MTPPPSSDGRMEARIVSATDHAVIASDRDGLILFWNPAAEAMFGWEASAAIGQTLDIIVPEPLRERHWEGYRRVVATGETDYAGRTLAVPASRADGSRISVEFTVSLLYDDAGAVAAVAAIMRDVTAAWEERRALHRRLAELERQVATLPG